MNDVSMGQLVKTYLKIKDKRSELKKAYEAQDKELSDQQDSVSQAMLELLKSSDSLGAKTEFGTVSKVTKTEYWTSDWGSLYDIMTRYEAPYLLQARIHQSNMKAFLEKNPEALPMGMNLNTAYSISVRRATVKD